MTQEEALGRLNLYDDITPLSDTNSINILLDAIRHKTRGADVREAIASALEVTYKTAASEGNANMEVAQARAEFTNLDERFSDILNRLQNIASGSPKGTYKNLEALQSALPDGESGIYVTTDNGHWYYYNSGWKDGGVYQSKNTEIDINDFSEKMLDLFNFEVRWIDLDLVPNSFFSHPGSQVVSNENANRTNMISVTQGDIYIVSGSSYYDARVATFVDSNGKTLKSYPETSGNGTKVNAIIKAPTGATGLYLNTKKGSELLLLRLINLYGKLGELATSIANISNGWEEVPLTVNKPGAYYSIYKTSPTTVDTNATTYKPISIQSGEKYKVEGSNYWNGRLWIILDKLGRVSRYFNQNDQKSHSDEIVIKDGETILLINSMSSNPAKLYRSITGMPKKTITAIGDSWTDSRTLSGKDNWVNYCIELFSSKYNIELTVENLGIGGTGFLNPNGTLGTYVSRTISSDSDAYVIFGSFNDAFVEFEFGDVKTHQDGTMYGAMHSLTKKIYTKNPNAKILFVTPGPWGSINPQRALKAGPRENAAAFAEEYVNAMIEFGKYNSIPVFDLYHNSGLRPWDSSFINEFYHGTSATDDTHPNSDGHKRIAPQISDFIYKEL